MTTITKQESIHINKFNTDQSLVSPGHYNALSVRVPAGINLRDCEVALSELNVYNSIYNITAALGNNKITIVYYNSSTTLAGYVFTIDDGLYAISDLNTWLQATLIANGLYSTVSSVVTTFISITYNSVALKVQLNIQNVTGGTAASSTTTPTFGAFSSGYALSGHPPLVFWGACTGITPSSADGPILPLNPSTDALTTFVGSTNANGPILNSFSPPFARLSGVWVWSSGGTFLMPNFPQDTPYNTVLLTCNLVNSTLMPQYNRVIFDYAPALQAAGTQLSYSPFPDFFDCQDGFYNVITINFVDENEAPVPINDPTMSVTILLRPKQIGNAPDESDLGTRKSLGKQLIAPPNQDDVRVEQPTAPFQNKRGRWNA